MSGPERIDETDALLRAYVAAFREVERPSDTTTEATWTAIERQTGTRRSSTRWIAVALVAVAAALLLALVDWSEVVRGARPDPPSAAPYEGSPASAGGQVRQRSDEPPAHAGNAATVPRARVEPDVQEPPTRAIETGTAGAGDAEPAPAVPNDDPSGEPHVGHRRRAPERESAPTDPPVGGPSALAEETALLKTIQEALVQGRPGEALGKVAAHRERFEEGMFRNEVTVAKAQALCALGRPKQARAIVDTFLKQHPRSHLVSRAKSICQPR